MSYEATVSLDGNPGFAIIITRKPGSVLPWDISAFRPDMRGKIKGKKKAKITFESRRLCSGTKVMVPVKIQVGGTEYRNVR